MQRLKDALSKLTNPIHETHVQEWYIQGLLPLTKIPLTQQKITSLFRRCLGEGYED